MLLELAEPRVRTGVWHATSFRADPARRLRSTGLAAMVTVYGPRSKAEEMIAAINRRHAMIHGVTPGGVAFRADEPALLDWVHGTASYGFLEAFHAYVRPLDAGQRNRFYAEGRASALLYGAVGAPASQHQFGQMMQSMRGVLEPSPIVFEFLRIMRTAPLLPGPLGMAQGLLIRAAVALLPVWVRERLGLDSRWRLRPWERMLLLRVGADADRLSVPARDLVHRLRLLTFAGSHPHITDGAILAPDAARKSAMTRALCSSADAFRTAAGSGTSSRRRFQPLAPTSPSGKGRIPFGRPLTSPLTGMASTSSIFMAGLLDRLLA